MTTVTRHCGVSAQQREAIPVILRCASVGPPALNGMAVLALRAELAPVEIRVTVRAARARLGKNFRDMARITGHGRMHAA